MKLANKFYICATKWPYAALFTGLMHVGMSASAVDAKVVAGGFPLYDAHAVSLDTTGKVIVWGGNSKGQLGSPFATLAETNFPRVVPALAGQVFVDIAAGPWNSLALRADGTVWSWGDNERTGLLGVTNGVARFELPTQVAGLSNIASIVASQRTAYAVSRTGQLFYWGTQFGAPPAARHQSTPTLAVGLNNIVQASAGPQSSGCAVDRAGVMYVWGRNGDGQLGAANPSYLPTNDEVAIYPVAGKVRKCEAGTFSMAAIMENGDVFASGELCTTKLTGGLFPVCTGNGNFFQPTKLAFPEPMRDFDFEGVAVSASGIVYAFGNASTTEEIQQVPELIGKGPFVRASGQRSSVYLAQTADGRVYSWGAYRASLGRGDLPPRTPGIERPRLVVGIGGTAALNLSLGNDVAGNNRRFAEQVYRDFLLREGDLGGIDFWVAALDSNQQSREAMISTFLNSPEYLNLISPITRLYFATFVRIPDFGGLRFWTNEFRSGARSINVISDAFVTVPEFVARYGNPTNAQYIDQLYRNILGRAGEAAGVAFWVGELDAGRQSRGSVLLAFSQSPEYVNARRFDIAVIGLYAALLQRAPTPAELAADAPLAASNLSGLISRIVASPEYRARFVP
jgi:alpha-tubulin suppressor-like RCC1 family protein